jgi:F420 biosynthesis protein FbiB-like protein
VRRFKPDPIPLPLIQRLLSTAAYAPSAHNRQPWRFCVVMDPAAKSRLADAMALDFERDLLRDRLPPEKIEAQLKRSRDRINSAPLAILLCLDMSEMDSYPDEKRQEAEWVMATQSVAAAGLQFLLAALSDGLGWFWTCGPLFAQETIQKTLDLAEEWEPQAMFFLGYPDEKPVARERKHLENVAVFI